MSICDKNNPPERSDKEIELSRQERERVESIVRNETLDSPAPTPEILATVRRDTNEFNRLSNIDNAINKVTAGKELKGSKLREVEKQVEFDGVAVDIDELIRIANIQNAVLIATSGQSNISFRNPSNKSDCSKNINDLLIEQLKKIIMDLIRDSDDADQLLGLLDTLRTLELEISNIFKLIEKAQDASLADMLILAKNAGFLDRIGIINDINAKFGGVISNLNSILANLESFDVCNMLDFSGFGSLLPAPLKIDPEDAPPHPDPGPLITINSNTARSIGNYIDHKDVAGDLIEGVYNSNTAKLKDDPSYGSLLTALNSLYYGFKTEIILSGTNGFSEKADIEIERLLKMHRQEWSGDILNEFKLRAETLRDHVLADADIIQEDYARRNST